MLTVIIRLNRDLSPRLIDELLGHERARHLYKKGPEFALDCRDREEADLVMVDVNNQVGMHALIIQTPNHSHMDIPPAA